MLTVITSNGDDGSLRSSHINHDIAIDYVVTERDC